ncbi:TetR/AcrR family transcriptional regulator [Cellulosilyticum ruminicola]|uniref:TetR/AcrR family transcriptional regulator n=1 Tax=Cellulosilyticum ruminicola TaxID=425254 RepID=UPI0006D0079B|nr:TetR/AcrR family transcriptional regulator [Cellulosilyticum ruminicola]
MTTKECILYEALELFSKRGYEAVSMRDISSVVGIRESSIYKHYRGKAGILEAIIEMAQTRIEVMYEALNVPKVESTMELTRYMQVEIEEVAQLCINMLKKQLEDEVIRKFRQLLTIEQYRNEEMKALYIAFFIDKPMNYQEKVFQFLIDEKVLKGENGKMLALAFFSPFFMIQYQLQDNMQLLINTLEEYAISFIKSHLVEG